MKILALIGLLVGGLFVGGCGTPGLSPHERDQMIARNWSYDGGQIVDDFDRDIAMLRPASHLTIWNSLDSY